MGFATLRCAFPGCLTSESEERETWTAESLRAVRHAEANHASGWFLSVKCGWTRLRRYTFQVNTISFAKAMLAVTGRLVKAACARGKWWDLVKRCDQPRSNLIQLESLILAQSERWRQA